MQRKPELPIIDSTVSLWKSERAPGLRPLYGEATPLHSTECGDVQELVGRTDDSRVRHEVGCVERVSFIVRHYSHLCFYRSAIAYHGFSPSDRFS